MKLITARVTETRQVCRDTHVLWLSAPEIGRAARPGQFVMVRCGASADPLLGRPFSFYRVRDTEHGREVGLLYEVVGRGTEWLSRRAEGDAVTLWGPLGHGYAMKSRIQNMLLVGGGIGVAPLVWMADEGVARGMNVTLLLGARSADFLLPAHLLPAEVELALATNDGTAGHHGFVTDLLPEYLPWADQVFVCGPTPMYRSMATVLRAAQFHKSCQALLEERMACGTGICYSCAVETRRQGLKLICKDGPRFELRDVY